MAAAAAADASYLCGMFIEEVALSVVLFVLCVGLLIIYLFFFSF